MMRANSLAILLLWLSAPYLSATQLDPADYLIYAPAARKLRDQSALTILDRHFSEHPELAERMLDPRITIKEDGNVWGYFDQCYSNSEVMRHLIAVQIKAMAEMKKISSVKDIFDVRFGIGSKFHKDKGAIGNVFSIWGHPIRKHILQSDRASTVKVYEAFRMTIKNDLKRFIRKQSLEWHLMSPEKKLEETIVFLDMSHTKKTNLLRSKLKGLGLNLEIPYEELPLAQHRAIQMCLAEGRPVIIATHMLESMIEVPMPSRAEITDISSAVVERVDCIMLSGETTVGKYPIGCVEVMQRIISKIEPNVDKPMNSVIKLKTTKAKMLRSALILADEIGDSGVVVFTHSGFCPGVLAALRRGGVPIYAFTDVDHVFRQLLLYWGVEPFRIDFSYDPEVTITDAIDYLLRKKWCAKGTKLVFVTNAIAGKGIIDSIQVRET